MTGFAAERTAIERHFASNWTSTPIKFENAPFRQPRTAWVALTVLSGSGRRVDTEDNKRWVGVAQVDVHRPTGSGMNALRVDVDALDAVFRNKQVVFGGVTITFSTPYAVYPDGPEGGWETAVVSVPFTRDGR